MPTIQLDKTEKDFNEPPEDNAESKEGLVRINLGCNKHAKPGYINVDLEDYPGVDITCDLNKAWPWDDNSVDEIVAYDLVEHLPNAIHTMNEAWRILKPGGIFEILVPSTDYRGAFQDPTHVSFWNENSFLYYMDESHPGSLRYIYCDGKHNPIICKFKSRYIATSTPNPLQISWVKAVIEAVK